MKKARKDQQHLEADCMERGKDVSKMILKAVKDGVATDS